MEAINRSVYGQLAEIILQGEARKATKIINDKLTVKLTRKLFRGRIDKRDNNVTMLLTVGVPNYEERKLIKQAIKNGEAFPIKKILVKYPTKK